MRNFLSTLFFSLIVSCVGIAQTAGVINSAAGTIAVVGSPGTNSFSLTTSGFTTSGTVGNNSSGYLILASSSSSALDLSQLNVSTSVYAANSSSSSTYTYTQDATRYLQTPTNMSSVTNITGLLAGQSYWVRTFRIGKTSSLGSNFTYVSPVINITTLPEPPTFTSPVKICLGTTSASSLFINTNNTSNGSIFNKVTYKIESNGDSILLSTGYLAQIGESYRCRIQAQYPSNGSVLKLSSSQLLTVSSEYIEPTFGINNFSSSLSSILFYSWDLIWPAVQFEGDIIESFWLSKAYWPYDADENDIVQINQSPTSPASLDFISQSHEVNSTQYYKQVAFDYCNGNLYEAGYYFPIFRLPTPDLTGYDNQSVCSSTQINQLSNPGTVSLNGRDYSWSFFTDENATTPFVGTDIAQTGAYVIRYKLVEGGQTYYSDTYATLNVTVLPSGSWIGASGTTLVNGVPAFDLNDANNWCGGIVPQTPTIPENTTVYMDGSYDFTNVTVECGGSLIITETGRVNITNVLTNGGLVHVINGGTIHYGSTVSGTCTGTYEITETFSPSRFWYVGPTTTNTTRAAFGSVASSANPTGTQMWSWNEPQNNTANNYIAPVYQNGNLIPGNGYTYRNLGATTLEVNVTGPYITSAISKTGLTRTGTGTLAGYHLLSNPYTAYLDLTEVLAAANTGTSNMLPTVWVRSNSSSNGNAASMVFDTYNAQSGIGTGLGWQTAALNGNPGGINSLMRWVAPMQGFWVRVNTGGSTGNVAFDYSMASANPIGAGQLRTTSPIEALARINVQFGDQKDQFIAALSPSAQNGFDTYDSEKMFTSGVVQAYAPNSGKKLVINTVKNNKSKISMPLTVECPGNGWYSFELLELQLEAGVLLLEDKLEGVMHDLTVDTSYQFYANSGVLSNRFVLHFNLPLATSNPSGPSSLDDIVSESQNAQIEINSTSTGKVSVELTQVDENTSSFVRVVDINGKVLESFYSDGSSFSFQIGQGQGVYIIEVSNGLTVEKKKVFIQ
jgi:hypothetical protein